MKDALRSMLIISMSLLPIHRAAADDRPRCSPGVFTRAERARSRFVPVRFDVTEDSEANSELTKRYGVTGLPTVLLLSCGHPPKHDDCAAPAESSRTTGFLPPSEMLEVLRRAE